MPRPIKNLKSLLAGRRMFANGGEVYGGPSGILASSQPLMEAARRPVMPRQQIGPRGWGPPGNEDSPWIGPRTPWGPQGGGGNVQGSVGQASGTLGTAQDQLRQAARQVGGIRNTLGPGGQQGGFPRPRPGGPGWPGGNPLAGIFGNLGQQGMGGMKPAAPSPMPMAQGGVVRLQSGGTPRRLPPLVQELEVDSLTPTIGSQGLVRSQPSRITAGELLSQTPGEKLNRIFPEVLKNRFALPFDQKYPSVKAREKAGRPYSRVGEALMRGTDWLESGVGSVVSEMSQSVGAVYDYLFSGQGRASGRGPLQARAVSEMIDRQPDLQDDILSISKTMLESDPDMDHTNLMKGVAVGLSDKYEMPEVNQLMGELSEGIAFGPQTRDTAMLSVPAEDRPGIAEMPPEIEAVVNEEIIKLGKAQASLEPEAYANYVREFQARTDIGDEVKEQVMQSTGVGPPVTEDEVAFQMGAGTIDEVGARKYAPGMYDKTVFDAAFGDVVDKEEMEKVLTKRAEEEAAWFEHQGDKPTAVDTAKKDVAEAESKAAAEAAAAPDVAVRDPLAGDARVAEAVATEQRLKASGQIAETFDKKEMTPKEATRGIKFYINEFKENLPEYEGMSSQEKGFLLMDAGLRVMAGQSPDAITNIAAGLKGIGAEFAKDAKEKRKWDRQVELSAAKYGLERVNKDRSAATALAKERRARVEYVAIKPGTDPRSGRKFGKGDVLTFTSGDIHDGALDKFPSGTVALPKTFGHIQTGIAAMNKAMLAGRIKYGDYQEDRKGYQDDSKNLLSGLQMKLLMGDAAKIIQDDPGNVLGATSFLKKAADSVFNTFGIHSEKERARYLRKVGSGSGGRLGKGKEFDALMRQISTKMITQILNEGNRTVSDNDRKRVDELVGAYSDYMTNVPGSLDRLKIKMTSLAESIDQGILEASSSMKDIEATYNNKINIDRYKLLQEYKAQRFGRAGIEAGRGTGFGLTSKTGFGYKLGDDGIYRRVRLGG